MRRASIAVVHVCLAALLFAQDPAQGPTDKKAQKSYQQALEYLQKHEEGTALWFFRDADKQDQGHCLPCHEQMVRLGLAQQNWKAVEEGAAGLSSEVQEPKQQAVAHYYLGMALTHEGMAGHQNDLINRAHDEFSKAFSLYPRLPDILFEDGKALAQLRRDDEAKAQFEKFIAMTPEGNFNRWRAQQFIGKPDLARANLVPDFAAFTSDGERITVRDLAGKVVLVHFWATSCDTCPRALPHLRAIARKFQNQPFVMLSVSADYQPPVWHAFLEKNDVPGLQCMEGFNGPIAKAFGVGVRHESNVENLGGGWRSSNGWKEDLPKTFVIDPDGVFEEEKLSDSLDGKLQDLVTRASQDAINK